MLLYRRSQERNRKEKGNVITRTITQTAVTYSKIGENPDGSKYVIKDTVVLPGRLDEAKAEKALHDKGYKAFCVEALEILDETRCMNVDEFIRHSRPKYQKEGK